MSTPQTVSAVERTLELVRYQLSKNQGITLCLAWAAVAALNASDAVETPPHLAWDIVLKAKSPTQIEAVGWSAMLWDIQHQLDSGVISHICLARKPGDFMKLAKIWSKVPVTPGDFLGDVYMAALGA